MHRLVLITGASKGIGAQIALIANRKLTSEQNTFLLIARDLTKLEQVKAEINKESPNSEVILLGYDFGQLSDTQKMSQLLKTALNETTKFTELYVFYNHGTLRLASVDQVADHTSQEFQINVISVWTLLAAVRNLFPISQVPTQFHVNISSLLATQMSKMCSVYSSSKASFTDLFDHFLYHICFLIARIARATLFKSLALEEPGLRVLNYQPGPVYTDMLQQIYNNQVELFGESKTG